MQRAQKIGQEIVDMEKRAADKVYGFVDESGGQLIGLGRDIKNPVEKVLSWRPFEMIAHLAMIALFVYVVVLLVKHPKDRTVSNLLLLLIVLALSVQIHQNINIKESFTTAF